MGTPIEFDESNKVFKKPESMTDEECGSLPVLMLSDRIISKWQFTPEELEKVNETGCVYISIYSNTQPPVWVGPEKPFTEDESAYEPTIDPLQALLQSVENHAQVNINGEPWCPCILKAAIPGEPNEGRISIFVQWHCLCDIDQVELPELNPDSNMSVLQDTIGGGRVEMRFNYESFEMRKTENGILINGNLNLISKGTN